MTVQFWLDRAGVMRAMAAAANSDCRAIMLRIAGDYDLLAQAEEKNAGATRGVRATWDTPPSARERAFEHTEAVKAKADASGDNRGDGDEALDRRNQ
jgi:hypothetical protein